MTRPWYRELPLASQGAAWGVWSSPALSPGSTQPLPVILTAHGLLLPAPTAALTAVTRSLHHTTSKYLTYRPPPLYPLARKGLASNGMIKMLLCPEAIACRLVCKLRILSSEAIAASRERTTASSSRRRILISEFAPRGALRSPRYRCLRWRRARPTAFVPSKARHQALRVLRSPARQSPAFRSSLR